MSVILQTPKTYETLKTVVSCLQMQTVKEKLELVIIGPSLKEMNIDKHDLTPFCKYQIIETGKLKELTEGRAIAIHAASAPLVSIVEDHSFPSSDWAELMIKEHQNEWAGVGCEIQNANPVSFVSWANLILTHGKWMEKQKSGIRKNLSNHNTVYKRDLLINYGEKLEFWLKSEDLLQDDLRSKGYSFYIQSNAKIKHLNISRYKIFIIEMYSGGRVFGAVRCKHWPRWRRCLYTLGSPFIVLKRIPELLSIIKQSGQRKRLLPQVLPALFIGLVSHSFGEAMGYAFDTGKAIEISNYLEFRHAQNLCTRDQQWSDNLI